MSKSDTASRAITALERIATQASRIEVIANIVGDFLGHKSDLYQRLEQEVRVSKSILAQMQDEATTKVEEAAKPQNTEEEVPAEVQAVMDGLLEVLKAQGLDVKIIPVRLGDTAPLSILDILNKI